jgi:hypothetical protein
LIHTTISVTSRFTPSASAANADDEDRDHLEEIQDILERMEDASGDEIGDEVYQQLRFDLVLSVASDFLRTRCAKPAFATDAHRRVRPGRSRGSTAETICISWARANYCRRIEVIRGLRSGRAAGAQRHEPGRFSTPPTLLVERRASEFFGCEARSVPAGYACNSALPLSKTS